eukprot:CAMPEP_0179133974 /NCGR_PEP_ID=MMETSP0796-20121207/63732_1 /TAXON_ID=73915 /ORGANISM="Pyrodinium bahamense, Strain pbaha01" /LENGTH=113 /DNA_ID=CAMNT_0020832953 /DNA_START=510 /DNA_END=851 /DNA_ORIENTATION=+
MATSSSLESTSPEPSVTNRTHASLDSCCSLRPAGLSLFSIGIALRNSSYLMVPVPSSSTPGRLTWVSSLGSKPDARMATSSSLGSVPPEPSMPGGSYASSNTCCRLPCSDLLA